MAVRDAPGAQFPRDAKFSLLADFRALPSELFGITRVVNHALALQTLNDRLDHTFVVAAPLQRFFHFMNGVRPAHQRPYRALVQLGFRFEFAWRAKHTPSIEGRASAKQARAGLWVRATSPPAPAELFHEESAGISVYNPVTCSDMGDL